MALLCSRVLKTNLRNNFAVASRLYSDLRFPDIEEIATGKQKYEIEQLKKGNENPFGVNAMKRKASTKSNPNLVPSFFDSRMVGCICEEESISIIWMWLFKGEPKRCRCGHWFKLTEYKKY